MPVSLSLVRDSFRHLCDSFIQSKVSYHQSLLFHFGSCSFALCISCTTRLVAYVLFVPIPRTLPWIFTLFITGVWTSLPPSILFYFFMRWFSLLQLAIMRFLFLRNFRPFNGVLLIEVCVSASSFVSPCCHALRKHNVFMFLACHSRLLVYYSRTMNVVKQPYVTPNLHPHGKHYAPERAHIVGHIQVCHIE